LYAFYLICSHNHLAMVVNFLFCYYCFRIL